MIDRQDDYLETRVMTASPHVLHLMVVDGAIRNATIAAEALENEDLETAHESLNSAREFVAELISGLDRDRAPEIVDSLHALFGFAFRNLVRADPERDPQLVRDAIRVLERHRETWNALADQAPQAEAVAGAATERITESFDDSEYATGGREWSG